LYQEIVVQRLKPGVGARGGSRGITLSKATRISPEDFDFRGSLQKKYAILSVTVLFLRLLATQAAPMVKVNKRHMIEEQVTRFFSGEEEPLERLNLTGVPESVTLRHKGEKGS
jgi:hypothetical protein